VSTSDITQRNRGFRSSKQEFLHHLRWRDVYHFHRAPVYQHFSCDLEKDGRFLACNTQATPINSPAT